MKIKNLLLFLMLVTVIITSTGISSFALSFNASYSNTNTAFSSPISWISYQKATVVIDPGHGGSETGAVYSGFYEKNFNLDIALKLGKMLEQKNIKVLYTRKTDSFVGLRDRADFANNANADLFISVHNNALPNDRSHRGTETLYTLPGSTNPYPYKINSLEFAGILQNQMISQLKTTNQGLKYRPNLAVLRLTNMPAVITEVAFMTNKNDLSLLNNNNFRQKASNAISAGVVKALVKMGKL